MFGGGYVYTSELASRGRALEKQREEMFGANSTESNADHWRFVLMAMAAATKQ